MSTSDQADLLKLSRDKLKQLCKERGHKGYSKCTKPQLVALLGSDALTKFHPSMATTTPSSASVPQKRPESGSAGLEEPTSKKQRRPNQILSTGSLSVKSSTTSAPSQTSNPHLTQKLPTLHELVAPPMSTALAAVPSFNNQPILPSSPRLRSQPSGFLNAARITPNLQPRDCMEERTTFPVTDPSLRLPASRNGRPQPSKKFLPPQKNVSNSHLGLREPQNAPHSGSLEPIGMPPSIIGRKQVHSWSIILCGISDTERRACILVSRVFRYAVYLSASVILFSKFPGKRLEDLTRVHSRSTFNFWPYLRARETELAERRNLYLRSFLHHFYEAFEPIDRRLWTSPDNPKQYSVAVRFVMAKFWAAVSHCPSLSETAPWLRSVVIGAREVVPGEIWDVTTTTATKGSTSAKEETFYVLEPTCEVIGHPAVISMTLPDAPSSLPIRVDWSGYVNDRILSLTEAPGKGLLDRVQWAHYEEYQNGISRHFLARTQREGEVGGLKRRIAEKYVLASVVENSVSGQWKSVQEMAHESDMSAGVSKRSKVTMKMYLSAHHHVESIHFQTPDKRAFHPTVATVQTLAREYYILKDNGMLIGTEEDGVNPLWQALLKCDVKGLPCDSSALLSAR